MISPAPIPTRYKGYHFRSRLEARWAVCFDRLGWTWEYEPEGYSLPSGPYLPDFHCEAEVSWSPGFPPFPDAMYSPDVLTAQQKIECGVHPILLDAWEAGRSARFEHGQSGVS